MASLKDPEEIGIIVKSWKKVLTDMRLYIQDQVSQNPSTDGAGAHWLKALSKVVQPEKTFK